MSLKKALADVLDNEDEPLSKRLKLADNAYNSLDLKLQNREIFLLKWLSSVSSSNNNLESWKQVEKWLMSCPCYELHASEEVGKDIQIIFSNIAKQFSTLEDGLLEVLTTILFEFLKVPAVQSYCLQNNSTHIKLLVQIFSTIRCNKTLKKLLTDFHKLLDKKIIAQEGFKQLFEYELLQCFVAICERCDSEEIYNTISQIVCKYLFINQSGSDFGSNLMLVYLPKLKKIKENVYLYHKLLFNGFCKVKMEDMEKKTTEFFGFLIQNLGFSFEYVNASNRRVNKNIEFEKSMQCVTALLEVSLKQNLKHDALLGDLLFAILVASKTPCNKYCYQVIDLIIKINPLLAETYITELISYFMLANNTDYFDEYNEVMMNIIGVFNKLRRLPAFISKLVRSLLPFYTQNQKVTFTCKGLKYVGGVEENEEYMELDVDKILPDNVLNILTDYLLNLTSKQVFTLIKTCLFHLNELIGNNLQEKSKDAGFVTLVEIVCKMLSGFLVKVNVTYGSFHMANTIEKLLNMIGELADILELFGNALVGIEHNLQLLSSFLDLAFIWGEFNIYVEYALKKSKVISLDENEELCSNFTTCNISALHKYLPSKSWCLIAERILNFGDAKCKAILEKLWIQKLRALTLSEVPQETFNEHKSALIQTLSPLNDYCKYLIEDKFASKVILPCIDENGLENIAKNISRENIAKVHPENIELVNAITYNLLSKINKILKKESKSQEVKLLSCEIFAHIPETLYVNLEEVFNCVISQKRKRRITEPNEHKIIEHLETLKLLPLTYLDKVIKLTIVQYLTGIFLDFQHIKDSECLIIAEQLLIGLLQNSDISLDEIAPLSQSINIYLEFKDYNELFLSLLVGTTATESEKYIDYLENLEDVGNYCKFTRLFLNANKQLPKDCKHDVGRKLLTFFTVFEDDSIILETLALVLQSSSIIDEEIVEKLNMHLEKAFETNSTLNIGYLKIFEYIFENRQRPEISEGFNKELLQKFVNNLKNIELQEMFNTYANIMTHVLDFDTEGHFIKELHIKMEEELKHPDKLKMYAQLWDAILKKLNANSPNLMKITDMLLIHLFTQLQESKLENNELVIDLQLKLIQNSKLFLTPVSLDIIFATVNQHMQTTLNFETRFVQSIGLLEALLKNRRPLIVERLPPYLQQYRHLLKQLCAESDTNKHYTDNHYERMSELAHMFEKLTNQLTKLQDNIASVSMYLIADILEQFQTVTLYPGVKVRLEISLTSLLCLCDQHSKNYLMRGLSTGCRELFKTAVQNYQKYHKFTGKV